jgi:hypothetical protein
MAGGFPVKQLKASKRERREIHSSALRATLRDSRSQRSNEVPLRYAPD